MDLPQRFPLAAAVVYVIDIPPSICGLMGQRDHMSSIPVHSTHRLILQAPKRDLQYSSSGAAAAADGCG